MAKYAITIHVTVIHQHRLVVECDDMEEAELLADILDDEDMEHPDDITVAAGKCGAKVVRLDRDCLVSTDDMEVDDVAEEEDSYGTEHY